MINPIYTLCSGYLLCISPFKGPWGVKQLGYHPKDTSLFPMMLRPRGYQCHMTVLLAKLVTCFVDQSFVRTQEGLCLLKAGPGTCMVYLPTLV